MHCHLKGHDDCIGTVDFVVEQVFKAVFDDALPCCGTFKATSATALGSVLLQVDDFNLVGAKVDKICHHSHKAGVFSVVGDYDYFFVTFLFNGGCRRKVGFTMRNNGVCLFIYIVFYLEMNVSPPLDEVFTKVFLQKVVHIR